jgi:hypothetical protein
MVSWGDFTEETGSEPTEREFEYLQRRTNARYIRRDNRFIRYKYFIIKVWDLFLYYNLFQLLVNRKVLKRVDGRTRRSKAGNEYYYAIAECEKKLNIMELKQKIRKVRRDTDDYSLTPFVGDPEQKREQMKNWD